MKIIHYGASYEIYSNDLQTFDKLPPATYNIVFNPMSGFSLVRIDDVEVVEEKIYGNHYEKIAKVLKSYSMFNRSLGVILSGNKGMGKSLFVQLLAKESIGLNIPVIMVNKPYKGVAEFIQKIDQEVLVVFDEFEKMFDLDRSERNDQSESQNDLLGLFDGVSQRKRLYVIIVNNLYRVSEFMLSRTGRFHYHIQFDYPSHSEVEIYLRDKLEEQYYNEIKHVIAFSNRVKLNYDSLRAIAFELNLGYSFKEAIGDLNILTTEDQRYNVRITFSNGKAMDIKNYRLNLFDETINVSGCPGGEDWVSVSFDSSYIKMDFSRMIVDGGNVKLTIDDDNAIYKNDIEVLSIVITHHYESSVNYRL